MTKMTRGGGGCYNLNPPPSRFFLKNFAFSHEKSFLNAILVSFLSLCLMKFIEFGAHSTKITYLGEHNTQNSPCSL